MAGSSSSSTNQRDLHQTPTWGVAAICAVIIIISFLLEKALHRIGQWLTKKQQNALFEALEKVKAELMVLGFISLIFTFSQTYTAKICIPSKVADTMLPCSHNSTTKADHHSSSSDNNDDDRRRRLLWYEGRVLASGSGSVQCSQGYVPLISYDGLHQLHILIFFLAVFHVLYSALTMMLGRLKIRGWKAWEKETSSHNYEFSTDPSRFRLTHETSFVKRHSSFWTRLPVVFYVGCFFRQFFRSVTKADYLTLRNGFITAHLYPGSKFNFQKYIKRSLDDDFKTVAGVSPLLWASFVIFLLLNVNGWHLLFFASMVPPIILMLVGTKLQAILTSMAIEITERHAVVQGIPLVQGSDHYFWFSKPQLLLHLLHFTLFQNAFQLTYFLWIWYEFGIGSCFHDSFNLLMTKIALGIFTVCLCSYITLPLYALVTQMGSTMKKTVFDEQTSRALTKWQNLAAVRKRDHQQSSGSDNSSSSPPQQTLRSDRYADMPTSQMKLNRFNTIAGHHSNCPSYPTYGGGGDNDQVYSSVESCSLSSPRLRMSSTNSVVERVEGDECEMTIMEPATEEEDDHPLVVKSGSVKETHLRK